MDIVQRRIVMPVGANRTIGVTIPRFSSPRTVFLVPGVGSAAVNPSKDVAQGIKLSHVYHDMVMVGQDCPSVDSHVALDEVFEKQIQHGLPPLRCVEMMTVFVTRGCQQIEPLPADRMRRLVRRVALGQTFLYQFLALLWREFAIFVHINEVTVCSNRFSGFPRLKSLLRTSLFVVTASAILDG